MLITIEMLKIFCKFGGTIFTKILTPLLLLYNFIFRL